MTEIEKRYPFLYSKNFKIGVGVTAGLVVLAIVLFLVLPQMKNTGANQDDVINMPAKITVTIEIDPKKAVLSVDGRRVDGNPARLVVLQDDKLHTIRAKADGYEPVERDVKFDKERTVKLSLIEIIQPDQVDQKPTEAAVEDNGAENAAGVEQADATGKPESARPTPTISKKDRTTRAVRPKKKRPGQKTTKKPAKKKQKKVKKGKTRDGFSKDNPFE
jgi:hypothetical protein